MASMELKQSADDDIGKHLGSNLYICDCYDAKAIHQKHEANEADGKPDWSIFEPKRDFCLR